MTHRTNTRVLSVEALARVEGEGAMHLTLDGDTITDLRLEIYEPPRFYEAFLRGRSYTEPPDITARICGICPVAYQSSATQAIEDACGVVIPEDIRMLRRLQYCGEWIESHVLHVYLLHAPDFLGYHSAMEMAADGHRDVVARGLRMKKIGNELLETVGGRAIHPINVKVGGFYRAPTRRELRAHLDDLRWGRDAAAETVRWVAGLDFPDLEFDYEFVALADPDGRYPIDTGRVVSNTGIDIAVQQFGDYFEEFHVRHSTALHGRRRSGGSHRDGHYFVGPLARWALQADTLPESVAAVAREAGLSAAERNPFRSIVVRAVEVLYAYEEAVRIIEQYETPERSAVDVPPRAGTGHGISEAPRGILYHRYTIDDEGTITDAVITPPTAQNQPTIEDDLRRFAGDHLHLSDAELQWRCEQAIRNYDPCISCSTHFLTLTVDRR